ncbi:MAG TPA: hypothetical protein VNO50_14885 [Pyrinomonadaceae bacterium]|nr:hypothetical protein [Pyrinomonadaceae bacterium]
MKSWVASLVVVTHLVLVFYSLAATPPLTPDFGSDFNRHAHAFPIAGHVVRIPEEGRLIKTIFWLDFPSLCVFYLFSVIPMVLFPRMNIQTLSWLNATFLFAITFVQWWLVGLSLEEVIRFLRKGRGNAGSPPNKRLQPTPR